MIDHCPHCHEPAHPSETDDDGYHQECRAASVMRCVCGHQHQQHDMQGSTSCRADSCGCPRWGLDDMEPSVVRIARALGALVSALPGSRSVTTSIHGRTTHAMIQCESDDAVRALASVLGRDIRDVTYDGSRWIDASYQADGVSVTVSGPHHEVVKVPAIDVEAAIAQAEAAP